MVRDDGFVGELFGVEKGTGGWEEGVGGVGFALFLVKHLWQRASAMLKKPDTLDGGCGGTGLNDVRIKRKKKVRIRTESGELVETTDSTDGRTTSSSIHMRVTDRGIFVVSQNPACSSTGTDVYGRAGSGTYPPMQSGYAELDATLVTPGTTAEQQQMTRGPCDPFGEPAMGAMPDDRFGKLQLRSS